jgi:hypothetical protein
MLMGTCNLVGTLDIDIGDYENQLNAWNRQDMIDYQLYVRIFDFTGEPTRVVITVKDGIPESSDPPSYLERGRLSTIPEYFSFIKKKEKEIIDRHKKTTDSHTLNLRYNTEFHYPEYIYSGVTHQSSSKGNWSATEWSIIVMPLEEGDLEIDIGDYENQLEAWNGQNMLNYELEILYTRGDYFKHYPTIRVISHVVNGISDTSDYMLSFVNIKGTIPEIYSFIKEREETIRNGYNGINRSYLNVRYDTEYHYPIQISSEKGHYFLFNNYECWEITLTPLEETEQETGSGEE